MEKPGPIEASTGVLMGMLYGNKNSPPVKHSLICAVHILTVKLLHHELAAGLITQEQGSVGGEAADHGGG